MIASLWEENVRIQSVFIIAFLVMLTSCSTRYQEMGFSGGVAAEQMTADTYRIRSRGNAYTSGSTVQDYILLKAAETTKSAGGTHFQIISGNDASTSTTITSPGTATTAVYGRTAITTYSPAETSTLIKPGQDAFIRVLKLAPGQPIPAGAISAEEIITYVGPRVQRG